MPYYKKYKKTYKKRRYNRVPYKAKPMSSAQMAYTLAKRAWYQGAKLKKLLNVEYKGDDETYSTSSLSTTADIQKLTAVAQGDTSISRDGNSILLKRLTIRIKCEMNASASFTEVRYIIFRWKNNDDPVVGDILANPTSTTSFLDIDQSRHYDILDSQIINLNDQKPSVLIQKNFNLNSHIKYDGSSANSITYGGIWILMLSNEATNYPTVEYESRIRFIDN